MKHTGSGHNSRDNLDQSDRSVVILESVVSLACLSEPWQMFRLACEAKLPENLLMSHAGTNGSLALVM